MPCETMPKVHQIGIWRDSDFIAVGHGPRKAKRFSEAISNRRMDNLGPVFSRTAPHVFTYHSIQNSSKL
jgi:hypothetical protein